MKLTSCLSALALWGFAALAQGQEVSIFTAEHVYFGNGQNKREVTQDVKLPSGSESYEQVILSVRTYCPNDRCDWWDRKGALYVETDEGQTVELMRFMTPYRVGARWNLDVTDLQPLLKGPKRFRVFIDTWVGPGHPQGDGWLVDATLKYTKGVPKDRPLAVLPLVSAKSIEYGNPSVETLAGRVVEFSEEFSKAKIWTYVTGHGQGNTDNCAEFCQRRHTLSLGNWSTSRVIWRDNCRDTVTEGPQMGTWIYDRAGWCPGDKVNPWVETLPGSALGLGQETSFQWQPEAYTNHRRDDYDNNGHTMPYYQISAFMVLFE
ncbi:peptide-N-glycosidase F-related protein [Pseudobacteriovorax antillogorgiicola]|uniref:Peptide-N-glycosidase F, N terminal n=1 Tax=Pseudobacteriovorax antillogorgiicola TaxID=1513793 RepID=A0A1Y6BJ16_9BACT|nr:peptide-N-glycosidase F-related protein [Pseudobacteriovorax antillogorgiicola]TCS55343.1 peptide-N-glycosidase F-like protein [Pseudobacteriovorax antillogorgiicola]SMF13877.1 Peptide-N-glycosidase F, N terminal [Pseudobacteriovorax antillogorgiicola]